MEEQSILEEEERTPPAWYEVFAFRILNGVMVLNFLCIVFCLRSLYLSRCHKSDLKGDVLPGGDCEASRGRQCLPLDSNFPRPCLSLHHRCGRFSCLLSLNLYLCLCLCLSFVFVFVFVRCGHNSPNAPGGKVGWVHNFFCICISLVSISGGKDLCWAHMLLMPL